ncbi:hypothetical protein [Roseibacillus persicicus]|uniref:hypothetical protein n=1 Tax=Roseibacillus persicicus TaxID=454148 RepID=UPI00280C882D|nr:hypothetical protein [Roseibacillus persicicus]MDQ8190601.1 hypothetical protein [Roseibacillus persicicus]
MLLVFIGLQSGLLRLNRWVLGFFVAGGLGALLALTVGHGHLFVTVYGARIFVLHVPLIFLIGRVFNRDDMVLMAKVMMGVAIPMSVLLALQFYSPQSAWVNVGVGGEGSSGFSGAMGRFRPSGTFSFTNGSTMFFSLLAPFLFFAWLDKVAIPMWLKAGATLALFIALPVSISRSLVFQTVLTSAFSVLVMSRNPKVVGRFLGAGVAIGILGLVVDNIPAYSGAKEVLAARFESAGKVEGGLEGTLVDRFLGGLIGAIAGSFNQPFFGNGIGMGTNVGAQFLSGERGFLIAEGEWGRAIGELGTFLGLLVVLFRIDLTIHVGLKAWAALGKGNILPWLLLSVNALWLSQGGWAQPTSLGFCVVGGGLTLAALKSSPRKPFRRNRGEGWAQEISGAEQEGEGEVELAK